MNCQAYIQGPNLCRNGFPQNSACYGYTCHGCGRPTDAVPACMNEDIHARWLTGAGAPRYAIKAVKPDSGVSHE